MESYDLTTGSFSGTSKRLLYFSIAAFVAGAAMLVAGSVMLGIGIHKYNQNVAAASPVFSSTTPINELTTSTGPTGSSAAPPPITSSSAAPPPTNSSTAAPPPTTSSSEGPPIITSSTGVPPPVSPFSDVLFMLDTSNQINPSDFETMKNFVANQIASQLPLGSNTSRDIVPLPSVGILGFSDSSVNIMSFFEAKDLETVKDAIDKLSLSESRTNPAKALNMFNQIAPTKDTNTNAMMVLASGTQSDVDAAADAFSRFNTLQNFTFVALGAAGKLNFGNLTAFVKVRDVAKSRCLFSLRDHKKIVQVRDIFFF